MAQHTTEATRLRTPILYSTTNINRMSDNRPEEEEPEAGRPTERGGTFSTSAIEDTIYPRSASHFAIDEDTEGIHDSALAVFADCGRYLLKALKVVGYLSRWPIAFCIIGFLLMTLMNYSSPSFRRPFEPLCEITRKSLPSLCRMTSTNFAEDFNSKWAHYSRLIDNDNNSLERVLANADSGSESALKIKLMEIATKRWITRVRVNDLKEKETLINFFSEFVIEVARARSSLYELPSNVKDWVSRIRESNDYALLLISQALANDWKYAKNYEVVNRALAEAVTVQSTNVLRLLRLIAETQSNHYMLHDGLTHLQQTIAREASSISKAKSDLLGRLWTKLGGNRKSVKRFDRHLVVMMELDQYSRHAFVHVMDVLQTLRAMRADLENIRDRVEEPEPIERGAH